MVNNFWCVLFMGMFKSSFCCERVPPFPHTFIWNKISAFGVNKMQAFLRRRKCKHKSILVARQWQIVSLYPLLCSSALCTIYEICACAQKRNRIPFKIARKRNTNLSPFSAVLFISFVFVLAHPKFECIFVLEYISFFFSVADRCHTPICCCDRNHILENILIVEKKNQQRKWTSFRVSQEIFIAQCFAHTWKNSAM